jgi:DNA helicase-2/ATP-dependent DNA helicase PcrA
VSPADVIPLRRDEEPHPETPPEVVLAMGGRVPTGQQWEAISQPLSPCAVVAGAGSGKTAVMAARVAYLAMVAAGRLDADHGGAFPSQILCLTFTNKAAEELSRRVRTAVEGLGLPEGEEPTVLTYHAFAARLVDDHGLRMGIEPGRALLSEAQRWQLMRSVLEECEFEYLEIRTDYHVGSALALADQIANHLADPEEVAARSRELSEEIEVKTKEDERERLALLRRAELSGMVAAYRRAKAERGVMDYGDQIAQAFELVRTHPEVGEEFRARFAVVLLDEYQDTNVAQADLLRELCGRGYPIFAVGDPDQNIYAWRGASLKNILRFHEDFGAEGADPPHRPLYVNFRSGSRILDVADAVIGEVPEERRPKDKRLHPHADRGEGRVVAFTSSDALAEGREIAAIIEEERQNDARRYDAFAVLCRKSRLFEPITVALREAGIPFEVVDLGGLLKLPEVVDVVAWLRLLDDPGRNIHLARLLMGPRWRIGYRDLVALARWSAKQNRALAEVLPGEEDMPGDVVFALLEALDHVDDPEMENLSDEARTRLRGFRALLGELREAAKGSLGDLVGEIVERTGVLRELEASDNPSAPGARRNLLNLIQHVSSFSPVEGEASLSTLVSYLDTAEETGDEIEPAQPSEDDTVKLLTIHKAKGLEWPVVFVPGLSEHQRYPIASIFPDISRQPNPLTQPSTLPFELRGDRDVLPRYEGDIKDFRRELRLRGEEEERRLCYVALTRAQDLLVVSASHWYEGPSEPHSPGRFIEEIATRPACEVRGQAEPPKENPFVELRRLRAGQWPRPARPDDTDELFPEGWHRAAVDAAEDPSTVEWRLLQLRPDEEVAYRERLSKDLERAELIRERTGGTPPLPTPTSLSVSGVIDYLKCPKLFFWSQVRPLPRRPSKAARLGSEVHRWIELQGRGQATLLDVDDFPDLSTEERLAEPPKVEQLKEAFRKSRFADVVPLYTERPFILYLDGMVVGGRIDAVFGEPDGPWEVVDYKTGRVPAEDDPLLGLQLDLYALACVEVWGKKPEDLKLTYFYLSEGVERTRTAGDPEETRARVKAALAGIAAEQFEASPGPQCTWCDFLSFCAPGREFVESK